MLNFRNRLLLLQLLTVVLTALLLGGGSHLFLVSALEKLQARHLKHLAHEGAISISAMLNRYTQRMEALDMEAFYQRCDKLPLKTHLLEYFRGLSASYPVVSLLDEHGDEKIKLVNGKAVDNYFNYRYDPIVQRSRHQPNHVFYGARPQDPQLGEPVVRLAYSYVSYFGDEFFGTLLITLPLKRFELQLQAIGDSEAASLALLTAKGELLTYERPEKTFRSLPFQLDASPGRKMLFGEDLMLVAQPVEGGEWQVAARIPWHTYRSVVNRMGGLTVAVCLLVMAGGALFAWKLTGLVTRSIGQLVDFAEGVGQGDYSRRLPLDSSEEFNRVHNAFNRMVGELDNQRRSSGALREIIETVIDPLIVTDRQGMIQQVNQAVLDLLGCDSAQILQRPLADLFPEPPGLLQRSAFGDSLLKAHVSNLETRIRSCCGREVPVLFSSAPCGKNASRFGVVAIIKDVTELMAARDAREKALLQAEEARRRIDVLLRSVPDGLVVTDPLGRILLINEPAEKLLDRERQDLIRDLTLQIFRTGSEMERSFDIPLTRGHNRELRVVQANISEIRDNQGQISGLVMLLRDVSRERTMEQMKNEFISTAAHELRTPLTSILGYAELMLEPENRERFSQEEQREFLAEILERAETLARIIDELLSISRIESGQPMALDVTPTRIAPLIERVVQQFRLTAPDHRFEQNLSAEDDLLPIDGGRVQQVLENLLSNAVKYSDAGSLVAVRGHSGPDGYRIVVKDQGIGMTSDQLAQVFDKFYRVDYSNTKKSGLGIGMSIVKQIVEGHGGQIAMSSEPGRGTRVELLFPKRA